MPVEIQNEFFTLSTQFRPNYTLITITGMFNLEILVEARNTLLELLEPVPKNLVFDLSECDELDSSSIGLISNIYKRLNSTGFRLGIINPSKNVMELLENTKIVNIIPNFLSLEEADKFFE